MRLDRLKVLIVDDHENARALLSQMLRALGAAHIFEARDGVEGLRVLGEHDIDIVLADLVMAPMDGLTFVRALRTSPHSRRPRAPVIMVSGHSTLKSIMSARDAGVDEFLAKPLSARDLVDRLHRVIERQQPFVRTPTYFGPDRRRRAQARHRGPWRRSTDRPNVRAVEI